MRVSNTCSASVENATTATTRKVAGSGWRGIGAVAAGSLTAPPPPPSSRRRQGRGNTGGHGHSATLLLSCPDQKGLVADDGRLGVPARRQHRPRRPAHRRERGRLLPARRVRARRLRPRPRRDRPGVWRRCSSASPCAARSASRTSARESPSSCRSRPTACTTCSPGGGRASSTPTIPLVISNHPDHADVGQHFGVAFHTCR